MDPSSDQNKQLPESEDINQSLELAKSGDSGTSSSATSIFVKRTHKKIFGILAAIVIMSVATFAGLTTFIEKEIPTAVIPVAKKVTQKKGTITAVDDLMTKDLVDEAKANDQIIKTASDDITDIVDEVATLEESYDGF